MSHQVFIESCGAGREANLAQAIAARYGVAAEQISSRLGRGRFRVKANLSRAAADEFVSWLESLGARCAIDDAHGATVFRSRTEPVPQESPDDFLTLQTPVPGDFESGLSAAFTKGQAQELGALGGEGAGLRLSTLDGDDDTPVKATTPALAPRAAQDDSAFLPPEMVDEAKFELSVDRAPDKPATRVEASDVASAGPREQAAAELRSTIDGEAPPVTTLPPTAREKFLAAMADNERHRWVAGLAVAFVVGALVVHLLGLALESSRYQPVLDVLRADFSAADTPSSWDSLDESIAIAKEAIAGHRKSIASLCTLVWLALAAGIVFVWMRVLDWQRLAGKRA